MKNKVIVRRESGQLAVGQVTTQAEAAEIERRAFVTQGYRRVIAEVAEAIWRGETPWRETGKIEL